MLILNKILPVFVLPFGVSLILLAWGLGRRRRALVAAGLVILLVSSNPLVARYLVRWTENWEERRNAATVPVADAIVVLSAGRAAPPGGSGISEWGDANRYFGGLELFQAGRAPLLVFTGAFVGPGAPLEGEVLAAYARTHGVPAGQILVTGMVGNTADEAREVAGVLRARQPGPARIVLVTSAFHMRRARLQFEQQGLVVEPFPVHFLIGAGDGVSLLHLVPSASALAQTQTAVRELYGRAFYRVVNW